MSMIRLGSISLDCAEPRVLGAFWADLLGGEIALVNHDLCIVKLDHVLLTALKVDSYAPPTWPASSLPKQVHIDVDVDDVDEAVARAASLGAVRAETQPDPQTYVVFLDPAGHPFCLTTQITDDLRPGR